jgi:16S rRNA processing protein RimM
LPPLVIVGRIRKPHGIHGELVVEAVSDEPGETFAPGRRVFVGDENGVPSGAEPAPIEIMSSRPFKDAWLLGLRGIRDRTEAEHWRERYLLVPAGDVRAPEGDEVWLHEIEGMQVVDVAGNAIGPVCGVQHVPQGLLITVRTSRGEASIPFVEPIIVGVDREARVITADPPQGLLDL